MPWVSVIGAQSVHKSARIRTRISARMKTAAALIVTRGADARPRARKPQKHDLESTRVTDAVATQAVAVPVTRSGKENVKAKGKAAPPPLEDEDLELIFNGTEVGPQKWVAHGAQHQVPL
jgi:hypothetical protein